MTDDAKALVEQLEAWAPLVSAGYEVPAAGQTMMNASRALTAQAEEIERLREVVSRVRCAVDFIPPDSKGEIGKRIERDLISGLSLRTIAKKQGVGIGVVRGVADRSAALKAAQEVKA